MLVSVLSGVDGSAWTLCGGVGAWSIDAHSSGSTVTTHTATMGPSAWMISWPNWNGRATPGRCSQVFISRVMARNSHPTRRTVGEVIGWPRDARNARVITTVNKASDTNGSTAQANHHAAPNRGAPPAANACTPAV